MSIFVDYKTNYTVNEIKKLDAKTSKLIVSSSFSGTNHSEYGIT